MPYRIPWSKALSALLFATGVVFTWAGAKMVLENSHFHGDDLHDFLLLLERSFWDYIVTPTDIHFVPLHRLASYLLYKIRPLDFPTALFVMLTVHIAGTFYLYRALQALSRNDLNRLLTFVYITNVYVFAQLIWWNSGVLRFPYILCAAASLYHYLRYRDAPSYRHLIALVAFMAIGMGFYSKAFLIPAYLLAIEICLINRTPREQVARNLLLAGILCVVSVLCFALTRTIVAERFAQFHFDWNTFLSGEKATIILLSRGMLTLHGPHSSLYGVLSAAFWVLLFLYSVARRPFNAVVWLAGLGVIVLNIAAISVSARAARNTGAFVYVPRYYHELTFLVVIFLSLILNNCIGEERSRLLSKRGVSGILRASLAVLVVVYALSSYSHARMLLERRFLGTRQAKEFMENLVHGLGEIRADGLQDVAFVDGRVPNHVAGGFVPIRYSRFLRLFDLHEAVATRAGKQAWKPAWKRARNVYRIDERGRVIRVSRRP